MPTHDSSNPPVTPSPDPASHWAMEKLKAARAEAADALEQSRDTATALERIEGVIGVSPNVALGIAGSGVLGGFAMICNKVDGLAASVEKLTTAFAADQAAAKDRRDNLAWALKVVVGALLVTGVGALIAFFSTFHR